MSERTESFCLIRILIFSICLVVGIAVLPALANAPPNDSYSSNLNDGSPEILWQGTVTVVNGTTVSFTACNEPYSTYTVNATTDVGALAATGLAFNASDEWYAPYGCFLLNGIAGIEGLEWPDYTWAMYINGAPTAKGLGTNELGTGDSVTFYYCPADPGTSEYLINESTYIVDITVITAPPTPASGSYLTLQYDAQRTGNVSGTGPGTATLLWQSSEKTAGCIQAGPIIVNDRIYMVAWSSWMAGNATNALYCLDRETGRELWNNTDVYGGSTPAFASDKLFLGTTAETLACINATTGAVLWNEPIDPSNSFHGVASSPVVHGDMVYILSSSDGTLHAFSFDGTEQWNFSTGGQIFYYTSPAAYAEKLLFAGHSGSQHALYCMNLSTHDEVWNFTTATEIRATPTIWADKNLVFFTTKYVYGKAHGLYALNLSTGEESWNVTHQSSWASPALSDGRLYIGGSAVDSTFYCYNARNGSLIWKNESMGGAIDSSPVVAGGKVYFGTNEVDGTVFALDADTGRLVWSYTLQIPPGYTGGYNVASPPAIADRTLFIGVDNIGVLAFRDPFAEFDTGTPEHPYPSIPGTIYGTLRPAHDLLVNTMLTRACDGTGGIAKYVRIWNDTWIGATAQWDGYRGDWHNISFPEPLLLHKNETYHYRIDTGSYPQQHHKNTLTVSDGVITCTNFTDTNGVIHTGVIPAIRLYYRWDERA